MITEWPRRSRRSHTSDRSLAGESLEQRRMLATDLTFAPPIAYPVGDNPEHVTVADINSDGIADILTANFFSKDVSVLLGRGDGTFADAVNYRASSGSVAVAVADLNADTILDLAVANLEEDSVSVLFGLENGGFARHVDLGTGVFPENVAAADLDNDGNVDLMVPHTGLPTEPGGLSVLWGLGDGQFGLAVELVEDLRPSAVEVAHLNEDTILDIVLANGFPFVPGNDDVVVLIGEEGGSFASPARYTIEAAETPINIAIADFNGDRILDVAPVNSSSENVSVFMGVGDGTLNQEMAMTYNVPSTGFFSSITSGDMNGDGAEDIIVTTDESIAILINSGEGDFGDSIGVPIFGGPSWVAVADFNQDGRLDVAAVIQGAILQESVVEVTINTVAGDANRDGRFDQLDVVAVLQAGTYLNGEPANWSQGDWNSDGVFDQQDIVTAQQAGGYLV